MTLKPWLHAPSERASWLGQLPASCVRTSPVQRLAFQCNGPATVPLADQSLAPFDRALLPSEENKVCKKQSRANQPYLFHFLILSILMQLCNSSLRLIFLLRTYLENIIFSVIIAIHIYIFYPSIILAWIFQCLCHSQCRPLLFMMILCFS